MKNFWYHYRRLTPQDHITMWSGILMTVALFVGMWASSKGNTEVATYAISAFFASMFVMTGALLHLKFTNEYKRRESLQLQTKRTTQYIIYQCTLRQLQMGMNPSEYAQYFNGFIAICDDKSVEPPVGWNILFTFPSVDDLALHIANGWLIQDNFNRMCIITGMGDSPAYQLIAEDGTVIAHTDPDYSGYDMCTADQEPDYDNMARDMEDAEFESDNFEGYGNYRV